MDAIRYLQHADIEQATGLSPKKIQDWLDRGILAGHIGQPGKGGRRLYSVADAVMLAVANELVQNYGASIPVAVRVGSSVREWLLSHQGNPDPPFFVAEGETVAMVQNLAQLGARASILAVNAREVINEVRRVLSDPASAFA